MEEALKFIDSNVGDAVEELQQFVRIPSISAGGSTDSSVYIDQAVDFLIDKFVSIEFTAEKIRLGPAENPLVIARSPDFSTEKETVLFYGHYDVQGVDNPREAWTVDPFIGLKREGYLIARGASDNKGPTFAHIKGIEAVLKSIDSLPYNIVFIIEGEEECGSGALESFIDNGGLNEFAPFLCTVISDTSMYGPERPSLTVGLRGISYLEVTIQGPTQDVHSGLFGGIIHNPNTVMIQALNSLFDKSGNVSIPGFFENIVTISGEEKALYQSLKAEKNQYCRELGVSSLKSSPDFNILEQRWTQPTLDVNYLNGGSPRTVIPAEAKSALSARLVPGQDPLRIENLIKSQIRSRIPKGASVTFSNEHKAPAYLLDREHSLVQPALNAIREGFKIEPLITREGGSIPIVTNIAARTKSPVLLIGFGQITDNWHGPNEKFALCDFHRGMRTSAALIYELMNHSNHSF